MKAENILQILKDTKEQTNIRARMLYDTDPEKYDAIINDDSILILSRSELAGIKSIVGDKKNHRVIMKWNDHKKCGVRKVRASIKESEEKDG